MPNHVPSPLSDPLSDPPSDPSSQDDRQTAAAAAGEFLHDPLKLRQLADRVYELLLDDLRRQQKRDRNYGGFF